MTPWYLRWNHALLALVASAALLLLPGCAAPVPPVLPPTLLHDALLGDPARPAEADQAMVIDDTMRAYVRGLQGTTTRDRGRPQALADALYLRDGLQLRYDDAFTRNAAQAFAARSGNCLSLVLMTAALAREMGLAVVFQSAGVGASYGRSDDLMFYAGHVNLVLAPRYTRLQSMGVHLVRDPDSIQIDFLPPELARGLRSEPITEQRVLAMYLNNRAVEALRDGPPAAAYAWVREALRHDAGFWPAYNTLGVVYQRAGHLPAAAAVYQHLLAQQPGSVPAMANLAQVLQALGRPDEAATWQARRLALEPHRPFHFLDLATTALARGELADAERLLDRELAVTGPTHELYYQRARLHAARGDGARVQQDLIDAIDNSSTPRQRRVYADKLERLRAQAGP